MTSSIKPYKWVQFVMETTENHLFTIKRLIYYYDFQASYFHIFAIKLLETLWAC